MRFQGENCTLSFGLSFDKRGQVLLSGTLWLQPPAPRPQPSRVRFNRVFPEADIAHLQEWLTAQPAESLPLPEPLRQLKRVSAADEQTVRLELELTLEQVPPWWAWDVSFPLRVLLEIRPNEYAYLTQSLSRDRWTTDLTW